MRFSGTRPFSPRNAAPLTTLAWLERVGLISCGSRSCSGWERTDFQDTKGKSDRVFDTIREESYLGRASRQTLRLI